MPALNVIVPASLNAALEHAASARATSLDSFITAVLSEYDVRFPEAGSFLKENLALDTTRVLKKTE
jgi:hypothetical protein